MSGRQILVRMRRSPEFGGNVTGSDVPAIPRLAFYERSLAMARDWLLRSIAPSGGSRAYFTPIIGWSRPYPETSGYIVPTLLELARRFRDDDLRIAAVELGNWLLSIQVSDGYWRSGLFPYATDARPSNFNTAQILLGLVNLARETGDSKWKHAAGRAATWLARGVDSNGVWNSGHYRDHQPAYYAYVAWPMLEFALWSGDQQVETAALRVVRQIKSRRRKNGCFEGWGFEIGKPAFTHTIAYTLQGLLECGRLLDDTSLLEEADVALERLRRFAELQNGRLPGAFDDNWVPDKTFECVTGSAQTALCLLLRHKSATDLALVNAAAKLVDRICTVQRKGPGTALKGAVPGSWPLWGKYMRLRYPNWAAKFHIDALMELTNAIEAELL
jgi:hypothetical protein